MSGKVRISIYRNDLCVFSCTCQRSDAAAAIMEFLRLCDSASYEVIAYADGECILDLSGSVEMICSMITSSTKFNI